MLQLSGLSEEKKRKPRRRREREGGRVMMTVVCWALLSGRRAKHIQFLFVVVSLSLSYYFYGNLLVINHINKLKRMEKKVVISSRRSRSLYPLIPLTNNGHGSEVRVNFLWIVCKRQRAKKRRTSRRNTPNGWSVTVLLQAKKAEEFWQELKSHQRN